MIFGTDEATQQLENDAIEERLRNMERAIELYFEEARKNGMSIKAIGHNLIVDCYLNCTNNEQETRHFILGVRDGIYDIMPADM